METKLTKKQLRGIKALSIAEQRFLPVKVMNTNSEIVDQLITMGLAESGNCDERIREIYGYETGYRLTRKGLDVLIKDRFT
jgi:hypothetical protein